MKAALSTKFCKVEGSKLLGLLCYIERHAVFIIKLPGFRAMLSIFDPCYIPWIGKPLHSKVLLLEITKELLAKPCL